MIKDVNKEPTNFFFYDLETSGLNPREDRIMQFAGQRTDLDLNPLGEPVNILVKMTEDALPSPGAIMVTKITPQDTLRDGLTEAEFCRFVTDEVFIPGTVAVGYNTVRFDDEFMRAIFWRNFYDPYEFEWKDARSRWDLLDVVRFTRALRPEGIEWPLTEDGKPTNRLELITKLNNISHDHAHDALSDVYATIAVAKLIREKQPKLFDFFFRLRDKNEVKKLVNLNNPVPVVYASGRYPAEFNKTTVVIPIAESRNGNVLVYDLRYNPKDLIKAVELGRKNKDKETPETVNGLKLRSSFFPAIKELCFNKCPAVAPLEVLNAGDGWAKIGLSEETINKNLADLKTVITDLLARVKKDFDDRPEFPPALEPEAALYDGFLSDKDRTLCGAVRSANKNSLADFHPDFSDPRLPELLLHYKGRNFPASLSEAESAKWTEYKHNRLNRLAPQFLAELKNLEDKDDFILEELKLYYQSLLEFD